MRGSADVRDAAAGGRIDAVLGELRAAGARVGFDAVASLDHAVLVTGASGSVGATVAYREDARLRGERTRGRR